ncbi:MAG TPA: hypothetical protein VFV23_04945 [Verrucomicrobiae bacterium]|nr:hypothetical protein [Verrucomicrobiae bacterium]
MKNEIRICRALRPAVVPAFCFLYLSFFISPGWAENFGDISASADAMYSGNTFHGYAETRVTLENRSRKTHEVTLVYPNNSYGSYGNCITRLSRTVTLAPGTRAIVPLLQPPLPSQGDGQIRVEVDGRGDQNSIRAPNGNNHCNYYARGGAMAVAFVSRSLDYDAVGHLLNAGRIGFSPQMATGAPDAKSSGYQPASWMPDNRSYGRTNWLELDYATPQAVDKVLVRNTQSLASFGSVTLIGVSGTNIATLAMASGSTGSTGSGWETTYSLPLTTVPVKTVRLDFGKTTPYSIGIDAVQISGPSGSQWASDARASSDNSASASSYSGNSDAIENLRAEMPVTEWSGDWLAYSPFDVVALASSDASAMPPSVSGALGDYLQAGGTVFLFGQNDLPATWRASKKNSLGDGAEFNIGFGHCFVFPAANVSALAPKTVQDLRDAVRESARYWQGLPDNSQSANGAFPVVANLKIPARGLVIIMLAFVVVIGPANIIFLNRRNRRTWMLWTIPAISLITTLLVFAYSLLREGITPDTRIAGLTVLDQATHRAATIGAMAFYCPLTPSGGLHFDFETEATPLVHVGYDRSGASREVDWTQTQNFRRGWVSARVPVYFHVRKTETRRERLQIISEQGKLEMVNGFGAAIRSVWLADANGKVFQANNVAAGEKAALIASGNPPVSMRGGVGELLRKLNFTAHDDSFANDVTQFLQPNTYIAQLNGNPFIENALGAAASAKRTRAEGIVFGILEPQTK